MHAFLQSAIEERDEVKRKQKRNQAVNHGDYFYRSSIVAMKQDNTENANQRYKYNLRENAVDADIRAPVSDNRVKQEDINNAKQYRADYIRDQFHRAFAELGVF
jgi:hypothetical protein